MFSIQEYNPSFFNKWNSFVESSNNGTIFHRLDFLQYHGEKFETNECHLMFMKGESLFAILPLAIFYEDNKKVARSPYGASFGGIITGEKLSLKNAMDITDILIQYLKDNNIDECVFRPTPLQYHTVYNAHIEFALSAKGFCLTSRDVLSVLKIPDTQSQIWSNYEGRCRTAIKKNKDQFKITNDVSPEEFFSILIEDKKRHNAKPTHTLQDLIYLKNKFSDKIWFDIATHIQNGGKAGICYFLPNNSTLLTFYMAQEEKIIGLNAINILADFGVNRGFELGVKYFDFGSSSVGFNIQNIGVSDFKESFGAKGYLRDTYVWKRTNLEK